MDQNTQLLFDKIESVNEILGDKITEVKDDLREKIVEVREDVRDLRDEVQDTYARESDCVTRMSHERDQRSETVKRLWEKLEGANGIDEELRSIKVRVSVIEKMRAVTEVEQQIKGSLWKWAVGAFTAAALAVWAAWIRGCV